MAQRQLLVVLVFFILVPALVGAHRAGDGYVGAERCKACHQREYENWMRSGHAHIIREALQTPLDPLFLPEGISQEHISYVIGGYRWKTLFLDQDGYIITTTPRGPGKTQYNLGSDTWVDYQPGQKISYDCGRCHTTGYSPEGHHKNLQGISGTWMHDGVQCEACHGPGKIHASSGNKADIRIKDQSCLGCHATKPLDIIPLDGTFLASYTEGNQFLKSPKRDFLCVECHDPHLPSAESIRQTCASCHPDVAETYRGSLMHRVGVACTDCHMAPAEVIAEGNPAIYEGDFKSHLFKIDYMEEFPEEVREGLRVNPGYLSVDYACTRCHHLYEDRRWAVRYSVYVHDIQVTTNVKIMHFQRVITFIGFLFALIALLSAFSLKNWLWKTMNKRKMSALHKHSAWITFYVYLVMAAMCLYFHFPTQDSLGAYHFGWFVIHVINGALGIVLYTGKFIVVRSLKKGWQQPGAWWGSSLFVFWVIQLVTVLV